MRTSNFVIICLLFPILSFSQQCIDQFMHQYSNEDFVNNLSIQGSLLKFASTTNDEVYNKIDKVSAMWVEELNFIDMKDVKQLKRDLMKQHFEELVIIKEGDTSINFMIKETKKVITNFTLLIDSPSDFLLLHLEGAFLYKDLKELDIDIEGMEHIKKLPKNRKDLNRV